MAKKDITALLAYLAFGTLVFFITILKPWLGDDIFYQFNYATGERISSFGDIIQSQIAHYQDYNGRALAHTVLQWVLANLSKPIYALINSLFNIYFVFIILKLCKADYRRFSCILSVVFILLLFEIFFFEVCTQVGYIWMGSLILTFIYVFLYTDNRLFKRNIILLCVLFIFSVLSGNGHETVNIGLGFALLIYFFRNFKNLSLKDWVMIIGFGIGALFLCFSPGSLKRADETKITFLYSIVTFLYKSRALYILILTLAILTVKKRINIYEFIKDNLFFLGILFALIVFNLLFGVSNPRQLFGVELFSLILTIKALPQRHFNTPILICISLLILYIYSKEIININNTRAIYNEYYQAIATTPDSIVYIDFSENTAFVYDAYLPGKAQSIQWLLGNKYKEYPAIKTYPTIFRSIISDTVKNQVYECSPGCFFLLQDKSNPKQFVLDREVNFMGIRKKLSPYYVNIPTEDVLNTENYNIMYIPPSLPFVENISVRILD